MGGSRGAIKTKAYNWKGAIIMGRIKAGIGALGGTLADQWKEFFYCESVPKEVLVTKGQKRVGGRSSNTKEEQL